MKRRVIVAVLAMALVGGMSPALAEGGDGPRTDAGRSAVHMAAFASAIEGAERIDNLRLQRITTGPMRGRLVVAGSLDHLPDEGVAHEVVVRMTMTVPRGDGRSRTVGRKVVDYRLPAGVSPQNMTLRWLLSARESRLVDRAGDAARVTVVVLESRAGGPMAMLIRVAERLRVDPLPPPPTYGSSSRSAAGTVFIPAGYYQVEFPFGPYYVLTSEDPSGAPYIWGAGNAGLPPEYWEAWGLGPNWTIYGDSGTPGPGNGYVYMNGSVPSWSFDDTTLVQYGCPTYRMSGSFTRGAAAMSWTGADCERSFNVPISDGSVTGMEPQS